MNDEEPGRSGGLGGEVARMLQARALRHPDHTDPVGITRAHVKAAAKRRRAAATATATAVLVVTGGAAFGVSTLGTGHRGAPSPGSAASSTSAPTPGPAAHSSTPTYPGGVPSTPPTNPNVPARGCDPSVKSQAGTAAQFAWPARGSLAGDAALRNALIQRATSLTGDVNAKLAYAGEDATTRVAVVFIDPSDHDPCGPGMRAVVFHGPKGTSADALGVQVGRGQYADLDGFQWAQRTPDGAMTLLLIDPPTVRSLQVLNIAGTGATDSTTGSTADGTLFHTYPAGTPFPATVNFSTPAGIGGNQVGFVVTANTHQAFADAVGVDVGKVATGTGGGGIPRMEVVAGLGYELDATDNLPGTEQVFWAQNRYLTKDYASAHGFGLK